MQTRITVFATRSVPKGRRGKTVEQDVAWQAWNDDPQQEALHGRLRGAGSFYWPDETSALFAAIALMRADETIQAVRVEGSRAQEIAFWSRTDLRTTADALTGQLDLLARCDRP